MYVDLPAGLSGEIFDLSRIEVLRGPQGTLYGRNSTGGNVNLVTADPESSFHAEADASYGSYSDVMTHAMVNVPVADTLALRAAVMTHRSDGYFNTDGTTPQNYGAANDWGARLTALWKPTDRFKWRLSLDSFVSNGTPAEIFETGPNQLPLNGLSPYRQPINPDPPPGNYIRSNTIRSRMDWNVVGDFTLTYVMGAQNVHMDYTWATAGQIASPAAPAYQQYWSVASSSESHEIDATYASGRLNNVLGATYFHDSIEQGGYGIYPIVNIDENQFGDEEIKKRSWGVFDQATYSIFSGLRLTGGVRYSNDYQSQSQYTSLYCYPAIPNITVYQVQFLTHGVPGCAPSTTPTGDGTWSKVTWKAGLEYDLNPSTLAYFSATTGYKQGGVQPGLPSVFPATFQPETVINYETGAKMRLLNNSLNVRTAVFYEDYTNIQVFQLVSLANFIGQATTNAGAARIYGAEVESEWNATPVDHVSGFLTYLHARYTEFNDAIDPRYQTVIPSLAGDQLPNAPEFSLQAQYTHDFRLSDGSTISPQVIAYWQSRGATRTRSTTLTFTK